MNCRTVTYLSSAFSRPTTRTCTILSRPVAFFRPQSTDASLQPATEASNESSGEVTSATEAPRPSLSPLDPPPPVGKKYPTPWVNKEDFEKYLAPLYARGWGVKQVFPRQEGHIPSAELFARYRFPSFTAAADFVQAVSQLAKAENHHPSMLSASIRGDQPPQVSVYALTHSATPAVGLQDQKPVPGITIRDLRFAILADEIYTTQFEPSIEGGRRLAPLPSKPLWKDYDNHLKKVYNPPHHRRANRPTGSPSSKHSDES